MSHSPTPWNLQMGFTMTLLSTTRCPLLPRNGKKWEQYCAKDWAYLGLIKKSEDKSIKELQYAPRLRLWSKETLMIRSHRVRVILSPKMKIYHRKNSRKFKARFRENSVHYLHKNMILPQGIYRRKTASSCQKIRIKNKGLQYAYPPSMR
jgi:hypothetical protein